MKNIKKLSDSELHELINKLIVEHSIRTGWFIFDKHGKIIEMVNNLFIND